MYYTPDASQAVSYTSIPNQPEIERAAVNYIAKQFGEDVALAFYPAAQLIVRYAFAGQPEAVALEALLVGYGLKQLPAQAQ
ncbi:hypothetical protein [Pseudomonas syringae]|uniref:Uncharacterized protein n=1 Tax=Pseudomonas syringae TaxID=317 RepID=A0A085VHU3_PSESX|nr:hypothetical protein [Pseudomonas syringae]KFE55006.1 hypothetical protein IV02_03010 [Pseudomonas syringae]